MQPSKRSEQVRERERREHPISHLSSEDLLRQPERMQMFAEWMAASDPWKHFGYSQQECLQKVSKPDLIFLVATSREKPVGFLALHANGHLGGPMIAYVCVDPTMRSHGVGTKLMGEAIELQRGKSLYLTVSESNQKARALYERLGFGVVGEIKDYNFAGESEFIMRLAGPPKREFART